MIFNRRERVYFARDNATGLIKVGHSTDVRTRIENLRYAHGDVELLASCFGNRAVEGRFHALLVEDHDHSEWFRPTERVMAVVAAVKTGIVDILALPNVVSPLRSRISKEAHARRKARLEAAA